MSARKTGIGERLRRLRTNMRMSQRAFADLVGSSASSISGYELEDVPIPADVLRNIVTKCGASSDYLLLGAESKSAKDDKEKELIETFREAEKYHIEDDLLSYGKWKVHEKRKEFGKTGISEAKEEESAPDSINAGRKKET